MSTDWFKGLLKRKAKPVPAKPITLGIFDSIHLMSGGRLPHSKRMRTGSLIVTIFGWVVVIALLLGFLAVAASK